MYQIEFLDETCLLFDKRTDRPCYIKGGVLLIGDSGVVLDADVLSAYDIHYYPTHEHKYPG